MASYANSVTKDDLDKRYEVERLVGVGGFGKVYTYGIKPKFDKPNCIKRVAVKSMKDEDEDSAKRELWNLEKLIHEPYVVTMLGHSKSPLLIFMECCNTDLNSFAKRRNFNWSQKDLFKLCYDMLHGLETLKKHGIIHRDYKPNNLLVDYCGTDGSNLQNLKIKICDFGASRGVNMERMEKGELSDLTKNRGTNGFMAPEIAPIHGKDDTAGKYTYQVDIWGFGITMLNLVGKGCKPFKEDFLQRLHYEINSIERRNDAILSKIKECMGSSFPAILEIISEVLKWRPEERSTATQCLTLTKYLEKSESKDPDALLKKIQQECKSDIEISVPDKTPKGDTPVWVPAEMKKHMKCGTTGCSECFLTSIEDSLETLTANITGKLGIPNQEITVVVNSSDTTQVSQETENLEIRRFFDEKFKEVNFIMHVDGQVIGSTVTIFLQNSGHMDLNRARRISRKLFIISSDNDKTLQRACHKNVLIKQDMVPNIIRDIKSMFHEDREIIALLEQIFKGIHLKNENLVPLTEEALRIIKAQYNRFIGNVNNTIVTDIIMDEVSEVAQHCFSQPKVRDYIFGGKLKNLGHFGDKMWDEVKQKLKYVEEIRKKCAVMEVLALYNSNGAINEKEKKKKKIRAVLLKLSQHLEDYWQMLESAKKEDTLYKEKEQLRVKLRVEKEQNKKEKQELEKKREKEKRENEKRELNLQKELEKLRNQLKLEQSKAVDKLASANSSEPEEEFDINNVPEISSMLTQRKKRKQSSLISIPTIDTASKKRKMGPKVINETMGSIGDDATENYSHFNLNDPSYKNFQYLETDPETNMPIVEIHQILFEVLKPHQIKGIHFLWKACFGSIKQISEKNESGAILAHCMGLGKSLQAITLIHTVLNNSMTGMKNALILCPVSTIRNWENEFHKWLKNMAGFDVYTLMDTKKTIQHCQVLNNWTCTGGVLIMGYEQFRCLNTGKQGPEVKAQLKESLLDPGPDMVICDEGHLLKNEKASTTKEINKIRSKRRIILTGTPLQNNLGEYFAMVDFIKPGSLGSQKEFRTKFVIPIEKGLHKDSNSKDVQVMKERSFVLSDLLKHHMQRLDHEILAPYLPPKHDYVISVMLTPIQKKMYKYYIENKSSYKTNKPSLFKDARNLVKIWNHPVLMASHLTSDTACQKSVAPEGPNLNEKENSWCDQFLENNNNWENIELSSKMKILMEILRKSKEKEDKVLVFSQSLQTLDAIEKFLISDSTYEWKPCTDYYRLDGNTTVQDRKTMIKYFNMIQNQKMKLFLVSTQAGGMGINLHAANRVVIFDVSWNPSTDLQSLYRVYRLGQRKPVYVYRLVAKGTMEEKIYDRQVTKQSLSARIIDEHQIDRHFKNAELKSLYEFNDNIAEDKPTPRIPDDSVLDEILLELEDHIWNYHDHDSLLQNKVDEVLSEEEQKQALLNFKEHQKILREQIKLRQVLTRKVQLNTFKTLLTIPKKKKPKKGTKDTENGESSLVQEDENSSGFPTLPGNENSLTSKPSHQTANPVLQRSMSIGKDEWARCNWSGYLQWKDPYDFTVHHLPCTIAKKMFEFAGMILDILPPSLQMELLPKKVIKKLVLDYSEVSTVVIQPDGDKDTIELACALGNTVAGYVTANNKDTQDQEPLMLLVKRTEQDTDIFIGFIPWHKEKIHEQMVLIRQSRSKELQKFNSNASKFDDFDQHNPGGKFPTGKGRIPVSDLERQRQPLMLQLNQMSEADRLRLLDDQRRAAMVKGMPGHMGGDHQAETNTLTAANLIDIIITHQQNQGSMPGGDKIRNNPKTLADNQYSHDKSPSCSLSIKSLTDQDRVVDGSPGPARTIATGDNMTSPFTIYPGDQAEKPPSHARIEDGKLFYTKRWFRRGQNVTVDCKDGPSYEAVISTIGSEAIWVRKVGDNAKQTIYVTQLIKGKFSLKRRAV